MESGEERRLIEQVIERLASRHSHVALETVIAAVSDAHAYFDGSRIRDFVPLFVERKAGKKLSELVSTN